MSRYNKQKIVDHLALSYALNLLKGGAKKRFEQLMKEKPFLRVHVDAHNEKLSSLVALLPDMQPRKQVWENISIAINADKKVEIIKNNTDNPWYGFITTKLSYALSSLILLSILMAFIIPPLFQQGDKLIYTATLYSASKSVVTIIANKQEMMMKVNIATLIPMKDNEKAILWCIDKDKNKRPINMGIIKSQGLTAINLASWEGIRSAAGFAISIESANTHLKESRGRIIYKGSIL
ncbi:MAG: hypothetical protein KAH22_11395 [Thiotrichaceae bacterium]|nr:hypothetical protein [Thiotrichaceae bacterium]